MKFILEVEEIIGECSDCDLDMICIKIGIPCREYNKCYKAIKIEETLQSDEEGEKTNPTTGV